MAAEHPCLGEGNWAHGWLWVPCVSGLSEHQGPAPKVCRLGVAPQQICPAPIPPFPGVLSQPWDPSQLLGTLGEHAPGRALLCQPSRHHPLGAGAAHPPWSRWDVTGPRLPSAHHPWSGSRSGPRHRLGSCRGSSPGPAGRVRDWHAPRPRGRKRITGSGISCCSSIYPQH